MDWDKSGGFVGDVREGVFFVSEKFMNHARKLCTTGDKMMHADVINKMYRTV